MASKNTDMANEVKAWDKSYDDRKRFSTKENPMMVGLLEAVCSCMESGLKKRGVDSFVLFWKWRDIVGKDIASRAFFSKMTAKKNGDMVLYLAVRSDAAALEMSYRKDLIIKKVNTFLGKGKITDLKFTVDHDAGESLSLLSDDNEVLLYKKHLKKLDDMAKKDLNNNIEKVDEKEMLERTLAELRSCIGGVFD